MNLKNLSNHELHLQTKSKAETERLSTMQVLWHLRENERRMLYAEMGYRDLKEYCVKELKYSEGSAWRRISAMRLLQEVPEVEVKIQSGDLNLTQVSMARAHFREVKATAPEKREILLELENQSTKSTERILAERKPEDLVMRVAESEKAKRGQKLEVTLILDEELQKELEEIQVLLGKPHSKLELLKLMTKQTLERLKQQEKKMSQPKPPSANIQSSTERKAQPLRRRTAARSAEISRYIPVATEREVRVRDQHRCQYRDPISGLQCEARFYLQTEHKVPFGKGGDHKLENLQLLCANHNRLRAVQQFGSIKMQKYVPSLRLDGSHIPYLVEK